MFSERLGDWELVSARETERKGNRYIKKRNIEKEYGSRYKSRKREYIFSEKKIETITERVEFSSDT